jgi:hypothetical protein
MRRLRFAGCAEAAAERDGRAINFLARIIKRPTRGIPTVITARPPRAGAQMRAWAARKRRAALQRNSSGILRAVSHRHGLAIFML